MQQRWLEEAGRASSYSPIKYVIIPYITMVQAPSQSALLHAFQALDAARSARTGHTGAAPECGLASRSAVLGAAEQDVVSNGLISSCIQGRDRSDKRAVHDCSVDSRFWSRKYASHHFDRRASRRGCRDPAREFQRHSFRLCRAPEDSGPTPQLVHRRATPRRPARPLRGRPLRPEDGR